MEDYIKYNVIPRKSTTKLYIVQNNIMWECSLSIANIHESFEIFCNSSFQNGLVGEHTKTIPYDFNENVRYTACVNLAPCIGIRKDVLGRATGRANGRATSSMAWLLHDLALHAKLCETYMYIHVYEI